uniref:CHK kinase-like domain-containing protein n=1 Tax=Panagrolaimus sp. ES5 TaxID=591445 RepID=A0AC34G7S8_9BILA
IEEKNLSGIGYLSFIIRLTFYFANNNDNGESDKSFKVICKIPTTDMIYKNFKRSTENNIGHSDANIPTTDMIYKNFKRSTETNHVHSDANHNKKSDELTKFLTKAHNRECFVYSSIASHLEIKVPKIYFVEEKNDAREIDGCIVMEDISENGTLQNKDCLKGITRLESKIIQKYKIELEEIWKQPPIVDMHEKYGIPPVVSHGDCWINNIFFYKNECGKASNEFYTLLDWQLTHRGNGLNDIARFLTVSVEAEMLEKHRNDFLQLYCKSFNDQCAEIDSTNSYNFELG